jgi:hypothetical protein
MGVCNGRGENNLGRLLMQVRNEIREELKYKETVDACSTVLPQDPM